MRELFPSSGEPTTVSRPPKDGRPPRADEVYGQALPRLREPSEDDCSVAPKREDLPRLNKEVTPERGDRPS